MTTDAQWREIFFAKHAQSMNLTQCTNELSQVALRMVQLSGRNLNSLCLADKLLRAFEDELYEHTLRKVKEDFVSGVCEWPKIRTAYDPHAIKPLSDATVKTRKENLTMLYNRWACDTGSDLPIWTAQDGYMHWLADVDAICDYATHKADGTKKRNASILTAQKCLLALCEALQEAQLKQEYKLRLMRTTLSAEPEEKGRLTESQMSALYVHLKSMHQVATFSLALPSKTTGYTACIDYLVLALLWGDAPGLLQPQRQDMITFVFTKDAEIRGGANYVQLTEEKVNLVLHSRRKQKQRSRRTVIDLTPNVMLCEFLRRWYPYASRVQDTPTPYVLFSNSGTPFTATQLSSRFNYIWRRKLEPKLGFYASGCNYARRAAVDTARKAHGKRKMTPAEIAEEKKQCRERGHTVQCAETHY